MPEILIEVRKSPVLGRPTLPCLRNYHAINLTAGCLFRCRYCYAQGYATNPGSGRITFYANSAEKLATELLRKRHKPQIICFSTATDPFVPIPQVLSTQLRIMTLVLKHGIAIMISTKARIPDEFMELFSRHRDLVHVQIGLSTVDDGVRALMEPGAANVDDRLSSLSLLLSKNVRTELRMDPLIPLLTDTDQSLRQLFFEVSRSGCRQAVASFLHLRKANRQAMLVDYGPWKFSEVQRRLYSTDARLAVVGCEILLPSFEYRRERFEAIERIGAEFGVAVKSCGCKNPDMAFANCHPQPNKMTKQVPFDI